MIKPVLTQLAKRNLSILFAIFLMAGNMLSQVSYSCSYDNSLPAGTVAFRITAFGNGPGEIWTLDNISNLYSNINPDILIADGFVIPPDPNDPSIYRVTGFAYDGVMPFATVMNAAVPLIDMNMITCMSPVTDITGDLNVCLGAVSTLTLSVSNPNILAGSVSWSSPSPVVFSNMYGLDDLMYDVEFATAGNHLVTVSGETINGFSFSDNVIVSVTDIAEDYVIDGPMYLCFATNENVQYSVNIPDSIAVMWSSNPGVNMITPLTGSGSLVEVDFPDVPGLYTLSIENVDPNGCTISNVIKPVQIVDVVDTISIQGDAYVCLDETEMYSVDPNYINVLWTVTGSGSFMMNPPSGSGNEIDVTYNDSGSYDIDVTGISTDGCPFASSLTVNVPGDEIESLACNNSVNVSLNNTCILELFPDMILEGNFNQNEAYQLTIVDANTGEELEDNLITQDLLGHTFIVTVTQECGGNSCWGTLVVEDKSITELEPYCIGSESTTCFDFGNNANPAGFPDFPPDVVSIYRPDKNDWLVSGFDNCSDVILSYVDTPVSVNECADPQHIIRTWTAVDINNGLSSSCDVDIYIGLVDKSSIIWPPSWDSRLDDDAPGGVDTDNVYQSLDACDLNNPIELYCTYWLDNLDANGNPSPECTGYPTGLLCANLQLIGYKDQVIPICGNAKKILRKWAVWDACTNEDVQCTQIITIMDLTDPICVPPADKIYFTDTHECGSDVILDPPSVFNECAGWSYKVKYKVGDYNDGLPETFVDYNLTYNSADNTYTINNLQFYHDSLWVQYIVTDVCGNRIDDCFGEFELLDDEQPIPACDLNTSIALNNGGHAHAGPATFDDHSWDNCGVYTKVIQRMNSECHCYERNLDFMYPLGEYDGHYYFLSKGKFNGRKSFAFAEALDGYVAVIDSEAENTWLRSAVDQYSSDPYYIGLKGYDFNTNDMYWDNGAQAYNFNSHWDFNEPFLDENYRKGHVYTIVNTDGLWEAERQTGLNERYVIEFETRCGWTQKETFCCADLGEETMVQMKVIDLEGNHNFCMVNVEVQDFVPPKILCPPTDTISCSTPYDLDDLSMYGFATAMDDCEVTITEEQAVFIPLTCGQGQIQRRFTASDKVNEATCVQLIWIQNDVPFIGDSIYWPVDTLVMDYCTLEDYDSGIFVPTWNEDAFPCSSIIYTHDDLLFKIVEGACQKLIRTWTVVDWCNPYKTWQHDQVIKLMNLNGPQMGGSTCQTLHVPDGELVGQCLVQIDDVTAEVIDNAQACSDHLVWSYTIDYNSDGSIDASGSGNDASGAYPYGSHILTWTVKDDCDNITSCNKTIIVDDNKAPTPYCHGEIVIPINSEEGVDIWVSDIDLGSADDCPDNDVYLSFDENQLIISYNVSCDDIPDSSSVGFVYVDMWVWDHSNPSIANKSYCTVKIQVQDNAGVCNDPSNMMTRIAGNVMTEEYDMIENVEMNLMTNNPDYPKSFMASLGEFAFEDIPMYEDYQVDAFKDDNYLNGVSTLDLVVIQRHILGIERLDSPYKIIAADINSSEDISAIDLIELRKLILGIYDELPENDSWRFVVEDYVFSDPQSPWPFEEEINLQNLDHDISNANFMGVKIGDVNGSVIANSLNQKNLINSAQEYTIQIEQSITEKGNTRVQLIAQQDGDLAGTQMSMNFDNSITDLIAAIPMQIDLGNHNIAWQKVDDGEILISWNAVNFTAVRKGDVLLEFLFEGQHQDFLLSSTSAALADQAYLLDGSLELTVHDLRIINSTKNMDFDFEVLQNVPNPFNESTTIGFIIPKRSNVKLSISDANGRLIHSQDKEYAMGYNEIIISNNALNTTGILYYKISTATHTSTKKMIVLR